MSKILSASMTELEADEKGKGLAIMFRIAEYGPVQVTKRINLLQHIIATLFCSACQLTLAILAQPTIIACYFEKLFINSLVKLG